jgi:glycolate oxidase iron-sulfur subunit
MTTQEKNSWFFRSKRTFPLKSLNDCQKYLSDSEESGKRYGAFASKIKDSTEFLIDVLKFAGFKLKKFQGKIATWHDPCHLVRYQNIKDQPRAF